MVCHRINIKRGGAVILMLIFGGLISEPALSDQKLTDPNSPTVAPPNNSGVVSVDKSNLKSLAPNKAFFEVTCSPEKGETFYVSKVLTMEKSKQSKLDLGIYDSLVVRGFVEKKNVQFMFGDIVDSEAHMTASNIYVRSDGWKCVLFDLIKKYKQDAQ